MGMDSCGSVYYISQIISISNFSVLSFLVLILRTLEIFNLFDSD